MAEVDIQQSAQPEIESIGQADIVLGILSYNNVDTIADVVRLSQEGLNTYFPASRRVIVHADGGSRDGTQELALQSTADKTALVQVPYAVYPAHKLSPDSYGVPGKGNALRALFAVAARLNAKACAVVDSGTRSLSPEAIETLVTPVLESEFDFVSSWYQRDKYDDLIVQGIVYPLMRALYGKQLRQPVGGDSAFSTKLIDHLVRQPQSDGDAAGFGADVWIAAQAASGGFRLAQAFLGPRNRSQSVPAPEVSSVLAQVLGSIFAEMSRTASAWQRVRGSQPVPAFGQRVEPSTESSTTVDIGGMIEAFQLGYRNLQDIWRIVLPPATLLELKRMASRPADQFGFDDTLWASTVYDFALAYRMRVMNRDHLLRALTPLYLGWAASYALQVRDLSVPQAQDRIERLCLAYEAQKGNLIAHWRWPDRFNP